jgi:hypothetical protein
MSKELPTMRPHMEQVRPLDGAREVRDESADICFWLVDDFGGVAASFYFLSQNP